MQRCRIWDDPLIGAIKQHIAHAELFGTSSLAIAVPRVLTHPEQEIKRNYCHVAACLYFARFGVHAHLGQVIYE